jgi:hypothetical protein
MFIEKGSYKISKLFSNASQAMKNIFNLLKHGPFGTNMRRKQFWQPNFQTFFVEEG